MCVCSWKEPIRNLIQLLITPLFLMRMNQPIFKKPEPFMHKKSDYVLLSVYGRKRLKYSIFPPCKLTWRVDIVGLHVCCKVLL